MKKLLMLCLAVFAFGATSFAQEAPKTAEKTMLKKKARRNDSNTAVLPSKRNAAATPEVRSQRIIERLNEKLVASNPSLALDDQQIAALTSLYRQRQTAAQERPKLETEADKIAFKESRRAASKEFKDSVNNVLTPEQAEVYFSSNRSRKAMMDKKRGTKSVKDQKKATKF